MANSQSRVLDEGEREQLAEWAFLWSRSMYRSQERLLRLLGEQWVDPTTGEGDLHSDAFGYVVALSTLAELARVVEDEADVRKALAALDTAAPNLKNVRNWILHPEQFALGAARDQKRAGVADSHFAVHAFGRDVTVQAGPWHVALWPTTSPGGELANALTRCFMFGNRPKLRVSPT